MIVIGLTGPVAAGKTMVACALERLGAVVIDADQLGHEVLQEAAVRRAIRERWGATVIDDQGRVKRAEVARRVFAPLPGGPVELAWLEQLTHPLIEQRMLDQLCALRVGGAPPAVVLDVPLLWQSGWDRHCDRILVVDAPEEIRRRRACDRGWTAVQFAARQASQVRDGTPKRVPDAVIDNSGTLERTIQQVRRFWQRIKNPRNSIFLQNSPSRAARKTDNE